MTTLEGRRALITGAGRGIGRAYAERFLKDGAKVVIADINSDTGEAAAKELSGLGEVHFVRADVSDPDSAAACVEETVKLLGGLDILVNNASLYGDWDPKDQSFEYLKTLFDVNLHSVWLMTRAAAPELVKSSAGRVINQASGAAYNYRFFHEGDDFPGLGSFGYSQTKYGTIGLTKYMAGWLGPWGITVNCIAPGLIHTEATLKSVSQDLRDMLVAQQPLRGELQPEDLVGAAAFFASDDARFVSGQVIVIDGGRNMPA